MEAQLSAGTIEYGDTGGSGPPIVFLHGITIDASTWRNVVPRLSADYRCITPTFPLGAHRRAMHPDADLGLVGQVRLIAEFLEHLDLTDVVLVANDWGGPALLPAFGLADRVGRLVLTSCEAFDNFPPGVPGWILSNTARVPPAFWLLMQAQRRLRLVQRGPTAWGWMIKHPVPREVMDAWFTPAATDPAVRRDLTKYVRSAPSKATLLEWFDRLRDFDRPVLIVWGTEDKVMYPEHGPRLAELLPNSTLVQLPDTYAVMPEDAPEALAAAMQRFLVASEQTG